MLHVINNFLIMFNIKIALIVKFCADFEYEVYFFEKKSEITQNGHFMN